jgi:hypothetical protein
MRIWRWARTDTSSASLIPKMTQVALQVHGKDMMRETPNLARQKFLYRLSRSDYDREWGKTYTKPGLGTRILSTLLRFVPKVGPFKGLGFNNPTPKTEDLYIKSINTTTDHYRALLQDVRAGKLVLPDCDLDDGSATKAGEYSLADESYANLLAKLSAHNFDRTSTQLRDNILDFYAARRRRSVKSSRRSGARAGSGQSEPAKVGGTLACSAAQSSRHSEAVMSRITSQVELWPCVGRNQQRDGIRHNLKPHRQIAEQLAICFRKDARR